MKLIRLEAKTLKKCRSLIHYIKLADKKGLNSNIEYYELSILPLLLFTTDWLLWNIHDIVGERGVNILQWPFGPSL